MDLSERGGSSQRHPWELARAAFLLDVLRGHIRAGEDVVDVGSGDAYFAALLVKQSGCRVTCCDSHYSDDDLRALQTPGVTLTRALPDAQGTFAAGLLLDVIEHVEDDVGLVRAVASRVKKGGAVLVSVPAWPRLFSSHDTALKHFRRYTPQQCRKVLIEAGLEVVSSGGFFHALIAPRVASVVVEKVRPPRVIGVGQWKGSALVTRAITGVLRAENALSHAAAAAGVDVPGLSFYALCRVPR